jgi:hypothetical protein
LLSAVYLRGSFIWWTASRAGQLDRHDHAGELGLADAGKQPPSCSPKSSSAKSPTLLRYATQMIHQESLFFVLPFFSSPPPGTAANDFHRLLGAAALISITDPLLQVAGAQALAVPGAAYPDLVRRAAHRAADHPAPDHRRKLQTGLGVAMVLSFRAWRSACRCAAWAPCCWGATIGCAGWFLRSWVPPATCG